MKRRDSCVLNIPIVIILACCIGFGIAGVLIATFFWWRHKKQILNVSDNQYHMTCCDASTGRSPEVIVGKVESPVAVKELETFIPTKLVIGSDVNLPLVEIQRYNMPKGTHLEKLNLPEESISNISSIMQQAPNFLANAAIGSGECYVITFTENYHHLMRGADNTCKAMAIGQDGKIKEIGNVQNWMRGPALAFMTWQIAALVTGQKFLADINKRLAQIGKGLSEIKEFMENERIGRLEGNYDYLRGICERIYNGNISQIDYYAWNNQVESIDRECCQIISHLKKDIEKGSNNIYDANEKLPWTKKGLHERADIIAKNVAEYIGHNRSLLLALQVKMEVLLLRVFLTGDKHDLPRRIEKINNDLPESFLDVNDLEEAINNLKGRLTFGETDIECQRDLKDKIEERFQALEDRRDYMDEMIQKVQIQSAEREFEEPMQLIVFLNRHGHVKEIARPMLV